MYKKIFSAILFGVLTIASTSTFVSCKDYDDDINHLQAQIDDLVGNKIVQINNTLNELKAADAQLKSDMEAGDAATLAAAKKLIEEAIADLEATHKKDVQALTEKDAKLDEAIVKVNQRVDDVLKLLTDQDGNIKEVAKDLQKLSDKLANFESEFGTLSEAFRDLTKRVTNLEDAMKAQQAALKELAEQVNGTPVTPGTGYDDSALKEQITKAGTRIDELDKKVDQLKIDLEKKIKDEIDAVNEKIKGINATIEELKAAKINPQFARTIGIAVDKRRHPRSEESLKANVDRLREYMKNLVLLPVNPAKVHEGETAPEEFKKVAQIKGEVMPIHQPEHKQEFVEVTPEMKKFSAVAAVRKARKDARYAGKKKFAQEKHAKRAEMKKAKKEGGGKESKKAAKKK